MDASDTRTINLLRELESLPALDCTICSKPLCYHAWILSLVSGYKDRPSCPDCLADELGRDRDGFLEHGLRFVEAMACYRAAWKWAGEREQSRVAERPACLWGKSSSTGPGEKEVTVNDAQTADESFDAGDLGCGDLVLKLRIRLKKMAPGQLLELRATDPGAPQDIPAWCSLTGHTLVREEPPHYWIQRKSE